MRLERGMEGGREKSEKDDSEARAKLCLAARSRKAKARLQRPGDGGKAQSASEERSHASVPEHSHNLTNSGATPGGCRELRVGTDVAC